MRVLPNRKVDLVQQEVREVKGMHLAEGNMLMTMRQGPVLQLIVKEANRVEDPLPKVMRINVEDHLLKKPIGMPQDSKAMEDQFKITLDLLEGA